jgi:hypothetical protein
MASSLRGAAAHELPEDVRRLVDNNVVRLTAQLASWLAAMLPDTSALLRTPDVEAALARVTLKCAALAALALATDPGRVQLIRRAPRRGGVSARPARKPRAQRGF